ncbi:YwqG family protein [Herbidospora sp. RD11066]
MGLTTPPPPVDVAALFPELAGQSKTTVRLHPRRGTPSVTDSSMGGPLLWPVDEPWPFCESADHEDLSGSQPIAMVPILQIYARHVPELPFPAGADVCQVLWCPFVHESDYRPVVHVSWRDSKLIEDVITEVPEPAAYEKGYIPRPCVLSPERVKEFPASEEMTAELFGKLDEWESSLDDPEKWSYQYHLSVAPGTKVGGWVDWVQSSEVVTCGQGHEMRHLLTIASWEHDPGSATRWVPIEERHLLSSDFDLEQMGPAGIMIGDAGSMYLFVCTECPDRPVRGVNQWS